MPEKREGIDADRHIVSLQLGRQNLYPYIRVVARCKWGYPLVILNSPVFEGKPFPTLFWLTCPFLIKEVSKLEESLKSKISVDRKKLVDLHRFYASLRFRYLMKSVHYRKTLFSANFLKVATFSGVGGIRKDIHTVKCLHSHYAFFLAGYDDPVGRAVDLLIDRECVDKRCKSLGKKL